MKSPLLPGEKLEGVQDALKGFQAANGVLWFHQEAGPGVFAVGGRDAFFAFAGRKMRKQVMEMARSYQGRAQGSLAGSKQIPKYHAKNHGRRDGHALRPSLQPGVSLMAIPNPQPKCLDRMQEPSPKLQKYGSRPE